MRNYWITFTKKLKGEIKLTSESNLRNKKFTIISNNCWGTTIYKNLGLKYSTPFVGLFILAPDYIKLLKNLKYYMECELVFVDTSRYKDYLDKSGTKKEYPIALLDDIEIHFRHYKTENEAKEKWERRKKRINWNNLYIKFSDRNLCNEDMIREFDKLNFQHKVCFTARQFPNYKTCIWFKEFENQTSVNNEWDVYMKYFDVVNWLNE